MAENTLISWAHDTFNPWEGCTRISPACDHCYAAERAHRFGNDHLWAGQLRRTSPANWRKPLKWNREAAASGKPRRVFCASLADVFDNQAPQSWRDDLWTLIEATPHLIWMLLTKRPQKIVGMLPPAWLITPRHNVWYGTTVEDQTRADQRIPHLLATPAAVRFLSCEPLLGPVDLVGPPHDSEFDYLGSGVGANIDWVIAGGESGPKARPSHPNWFRALRHQCAAANVPFHFKQWGEWLPAREEELPERFGRKCDRFRVMCSNGFVGPLSLESVFLHKPAQFPGCFPSGADGDCTCAVANMQRVGKQQAGRRLDGAIHDAMPGEPGINPCADCGAPVPASRSTTSHPHLCEPCYEDIPF